MNTEIIITELKAKYPEKDIFENKDSAGVTTEILCELEKSETMSRAIAILDRSLPHYHNRMTEKYMVLEGELSLYVDSQKFILKKGNSHIIHPGQKHYALGNSTWIEVTAEPKWTFDDHHILCLPFDSRYVPLTQQPYLCVPTCLQMVMLRHKIPLLPAELIGDELGLVVPDQEKHYFWNAKTGKPHNSGYGTNVNKHHLNDFFEKYQIPLNFEFQPISRFPDSRQLGMTLNETLQNENSDALVCFDWGTLFKDDSKHWGHVCMVDLLDEVTRNVRIVDPDPDTAKWRFVQLEDLYQAMKFHGNEKAGGIWKLSRI